MKPLCVTIQMKAIEQHVHVVLFIIMLNKVVLTFKFEDKTPVSDHLNESSWTVPSCGPQLYFIMTHGCFKFFIRGGMKH